MGYISFSSPHFTSALQPLFRSPDLRGDPRSIHMESKELVVIQRQQLFACVNNGATAEWVSQCGFKFKEK